MGRPCLSEDLAKAVVDILTDDGVLVDGYFTEDARIRTWVRPVRAVIKGKSDDTLVADGSCLAELMNVAWAKHEMTAQYVAEMFDFCEGKEIKSVGGTKSDEL